MTDDDFKLCYCTESWAYFTTLDPEKQEGDDWHKRPRSLNSGPPYEDYQAPQGAEPRWRLKKVAWESNHELADDNQTAERINQGNSAWLCLDAYGCCPKDAKPIPAGTTLPEFRRLIKLAGGKVYEETP